MTKTSAAPARESRRQNSVSSTVSTVTPSTARLGIITAVPKAKASAATQSKGLSTMRVKMRSSFSVARKRRSTAFRRGIGMRRFAPALATERTIVRLVQEHAFGCAVEILQLPIPHRPEKGEQTHQTHGEPDRDEPESVAHAASAIGQEGSGPARTGVAVRRCDRRRALATTTMEEEDMAMAATSGVTYPATAIGTTSTL